MALTRIENNQISNAVSGNSEVGINGNLKLQEFSVAGSRLANNLNYGSDFTVTGNTVSGNIATAGLISATGNVIGNYFLGNIACATGYNSNSIYNGTSNVLIASANGNITMSVDGTPNVVVVTSTTVQTNNISTTGNAIVGGDLVVNGNLVYVNVADLNVEDPIIGLGRGANNAPLTTDDGKDRGEQLWYYAGSEKSAFTGYDNSAGKILLATDVTITNEIVTVNNLGNLVIGNLEGSGSSVTGTATAGNVLTGGVVSATGTVTGGNVATGGTVSATGTATAGNVLTGGIVSATGTGTFGNVATGGTVSASGDITGGNLVTGGQVTASGTITGGNVATAGTVTATGTITGGNVLTGGVVSATGTGTFGNIDTAGVVSATGTITGGNVLTGGVVSATGTGTFGNIDTAGVVSATGNITGGNILFGSGYISGTGNVYAGNFVGNISGNLTAPGANTDVVFNDAGVANATAGFTFNKTSNAVTVAGTVTGGNVATGGTVSATGTGTFGNIDTAGVVSATGTITGGNVATGGTVSATGTGTFGNVLTGGLISATGNVIASNVITATVTTASGDLKLEPVGNIVLGNRYINGLQLTPQQDADAASKYYVDLLVSTAISYHEAVYVATTTTLATATGGTITYAQPNGVSNGIGATLTTTGTYTTIDTGNIQTAGTRILVKNEANAAHNGIYVWSNATVITRSSDTDTYGVGNADALGLNDYFFVQDGDVNQGSAWVVDAPTGTITFGSSNISFAQFSQAQIYSANTSAGLDLIGQTFSAKIDNNTTAFDLGGNIIVKAGANLTTPNIGAATGTSLSVTGTVTGGNLATAGTVTATGTITGGNVLTGGVVSATGTITGGNIDTAGVVSATGTITSANTITGGNLATGGTVSATGTGTFGNIATGGTASATGNITGGNVLTGGVVSATGNITGNYFFGNGSQLTGIDTNLIKNGDSNVRILTANGNISMDVNGTSNVVVVTTSGISVTGNVQSTQYTLGANAVFGSSLTATTGATLAINATNSILIPVGNTVQRPTGVTGMLRFNTTTDKLEIYDSNSWEEVGATLFTVIVDDQFAGDNSTIVFTLSESATTDSVIVSINGVVQIPITAYTVSGTTLTFTEAPLAGDDIDVRILTTSTTVTGISNSPGNASVTVTDTSSVVQVTGDLSVTGTILGGNINSTAITNGTSNVTVVSSGGNVTTSVGGTSNVMVVSSTDVTVNGNLTVTGNATLSGNILGDRIQNGTTTIDIQSTGGNANITVGGVANIAQFTSTSVVVGANILPTANITYDIGSTNQRFKDIWLSNSTIYLGNAQISANATALIFTNPAGGQTVLAGATAGITAATVSASGNITGGNVLTGGVVSATGNITGSFILGNGSQLTGIDATSIQSGTSNVRVVSSGGNVATGVGGTSNVVVVATTGQFVTGVNSVSGNITGGNLSVGTGTVTVGNIVNSNGNGVGNIGSSTTYFNTVFAKATSAQYADLAEKYTADADYEPGTVVMFGGLHEVTICVNDGC
jgi:hypothetical protein